MFEKFGEFDSSEEINRAAAAQLKEGDIEAVYAIAEENGLDKRGCRGLLHRCNRRIDYAGAGSNRKTGVGNERTWIKRHNGRLGENDNGKMHGEHRDCNRSEKERKAIK